MPTTTVHVLSRTAIFFLSAITLSDNALAFDVKTTKGGEPLRWGPDPIPIHFPEAQTEFMESARAAFSTWAAQLPDPMQVVVTTQLPATEQPNHEDHQNSVIWIEANWEDKYDAQALAITLTSYDPTTARILDSDIVINGEHHQWMVKQDPTVCRKAYDVQNVLTHEVGHLLGLAHSDDNEAAMYSSSGYCEFKKRTLHSDDLAGLEYLYHQFGPVPEQHETAWGCQVAPSIPGSSSSSTPPIGMFLIMALVSSALRPGPRTKSSADLRPQTSGLRSDLESRSCSVLPLWRRFYARTVVLVLLVAALTSTMALATTVQKLTLQDLWAHADIVVHGVVADKKAVDTSGSMYTEVIIVADRCLQGPCTPQMTVRQLSVEGETRGIQVQGESQLSIGDEVIFFLRKNANGVLGILGMSQGAFLVERDHEGRMRNLIRDLRGLNWPLPRDDYHRGRLEILPFHTFLEHSPAYSGTTTPLP